jgi:protein-disulfide isomerase
MHTWRKLRLPLAHRVVLTAATIAALAVTGAYLLWSLPPAKADVGNPNEMELAQAGPEGDIILGSATAPVTIIEYASMTCPHCAHFSTIIFPELQKRHINTGKVRFIFREFPLDPLSLNHKGLSLEQVRHVRPS